MTSQRSRSGDDESSPFRPPFSPDLLKGLTIASARFFDEQPWTLVREDQALRMDIPDLGLTGASVTITGDAGRYRGVLIFLSPTGYERFLEVIAETGHVPFGTTSFDSEVLGLTFQKVTELPASIRREALRRGLVPVELTDEDSQQVARPRPLADVRIVPVYHAGSVTLFAEDPPGTQYPGVARFDDHGRRVPLTGQDIEIMTACVGGLSAFLSAHGTWFQAGDPTPIRRICRHTSGREVRFTVPYDALLD